MLNFTFIDSKYRVLLCNDLPMKQECWNGFNAIQPYLQSIQSCLKLDWGLQLSNNFIYSKTLTLNKQNIKNILLQFNL